MNSMSAKGMARTASRVRNSIELYSALRGFVRSSHSDGAALHGARNSRLSRCPELRCASEFLQGRGSKGL